MPTLLHLNTNISSCPFFQAVPSRTISLRDIYGLKTDIVLTDIIGKQPMAPGHLLFGSISQADGSRSLHSLLLPPYWGDPENAFKIPCYIPLSGETHYRFAWENRPDVCIDDPLSLQQYGDGQLCILTITGRRICVEKGFFLFSRTVAAHSSQ